MAFKWIMGEGGKMCPTMSSIRWPFTALGTIDFRLDPPPKSRKVIVPARKEKRQIEPLINISLGLGRRCFRRAAVIFMFHFEMCSILRRFMKFIRISPHTKWRNMAQIDSVKRVDLRQITRATKREDTPSSMDFVLRVYTCLCDIFVYGCPYLRDNHWVGRKASQSEGNYGGKLGIIRDKKTIIAVWLQHGGNTKRTWDMKSTSARFCTQEVGSSTTFNFII